MAFNFGEVFLRESGAAQDRAQSMAEMQLRAKQFADNMAIQEANLALAKRAQDFNESAMLFDQALKGTKFEREGDLNKIQMEIAALELAELKSGNEFVTDEEAERYNVPKGTKRKDLASSLELRRIALQNKLFESETERELASQKAGQSIYSAIEDIVNPEVNTVNVAPFVKERDQLGPYERLKRTVDPFVYRFMAPFSDAFMPQRAVANLELGLGSSLETLRTYAAEKEGEKISSFLPEEQQQLREALLEFNRLNPSSMMSTLIEGYNLFEGLPSIPGVNPGQFIPETRSGAQND